MLNEPLTDDEKTEIERLAAAGMPRREIADTLGRIPSLVSNYIVRHGILVVETRPRPVTVPEVTRIRRLIRLGLTKRMTARITRRSEHLVEKLRTQDTDFKPLERPVLMAIRVSYGCHDALSRAARAFDSKPGRVAVCVLECAAADALDVVPHLMRKPPPRREPAPMASLFSPQLEGRL